MLKLASRGDEPTIFKGGTVYATWKGKRHSGCVCQSHKTLVSSVIRGKAVPVLQHMASPLQVGGLPKFPVAYAAHAARLQSAFRQSNYVVLFLDLKEAFYRLARPLLVKDTPSDAEFAKGLCHPATSPGSLPLLRPCRDRGSRYCRTWGVGMVSDGDF